MKNKKKISTPEIKSKQNKTDFSRRNFLKRSAYSAPVLIAMGQLAKPMKAQADGAGSVPPHPNAPLNPNP